MNVSDESIQNIVENEVKSGGELSSRFKNLDECRAVIEEISLKLIVLLQKKF